MFAEPLHQQGYLELFWSPRPWLDLNLEASLKVFGRTCTQGGRVTVGMHKLHLTDSSLRVALPCATCHMVPSKRDSPGHIDTDLPAEVVFNALASGKLRDPSTKLVATWDRKTGTCKNVYCHSRPTGKVGASWSWTKKLPGGIVCDSCHKGKPQYPLEYCKTCHPAAYKNGKLDPATHMC